MERLKENKICRFCCKKIVKKRQRIYCDKECRDYFSECYYEIYNWNYIRYRIWQRDNKKCLKCNIELTLSSAEIHHIIPVCEGGTNNDNNLITLCKKCHRIETNRLLRAKFKSIEKSIKNNGQKQLTEFVTL